MYPNVFDFKNPDYIAVFDHRLQALARIRQSMTVNPETMSHLAAYYRDHTADFIEDWGMTYDPRATAKNKPAAMPFILFPKQREFIEWLDERYRNEQDGIVEKSREMGVSWLCVAFAATKALFNDGFSAGFGSRDEDSVDHKGDPDSLFWKLRYFISNLPPEFRPDWNEAKNSAHMRVNFSHNTSTIGGDAGDNIGRGGRKSIYIVDESAHLRNPESVDASLSETTRCRIDVSSVKGMGNPFAIKRHGGKIPVFTFHWRDDPRKDDAWYADRVERLPAVVVAQEIDINYSGSVEGIVIPSEWVQSAVDAHVKLGIEPTGMRKGALDVADEGYDLNAYCGAHGVVVEYVESWTGKLTDIYETTERAFEITDTLGYDGFDFDSDGLGAGVRGDARIINDKRKRKIVVSPFRGSGAVVNPEGLIPSAIPERKDAMERKNKDFFANAKAQGWWVLRTKFEATYRASKGLEYDPDNIISLSSAIPELSKLMIELSQPTYTTNGAGKILIDKAPKGSKSPNLADAVMIRFAPGEKVAKGFFSR
jgi:phage terminase large subunit